MRAKNSPSKRVRRARTSHGTVHGWPCAAKLDTTKRRTQQPYILIAGEGLVEAGFPVGTRYRIRALAHDRLLLIAEPTRE